MADNGQIISMHSEFVNIKVYIGDFDGPAADGLIVTQLLPPLLISSG
jgi:hypothetical protein